MVFATPSFSRKQVTKAGNVLINPLATRGEFSDALELINLWRACHAYPVNTFQATLRSRLKRLSIDFIVATRLKRIPSIEKKLKINPGMQLARMQDVGGLRAIVSSMKQVRAVQNIYSDGSLTHELVSTDDYITSPKKIWLSLFASDL
jgi:putative GTP pyrophosphokinase